MTAIAIEPEGLQIGRVFRDLFRVLGRNASTYLMLSVVMVGLPRLVFQLGGMMFFHPTSAATALPLGLAEVCITEIAALVLQGAVIYGTVSDMNRRKVTLAECLSVGMRAFLPILGISILYGLACMAGGMLLVVPGLMIAIAWCVAIPAYVAERIDLLDSFGRSAALTRGSRWRLLGIGLLFWLLVLVCFMVAAIPTVVMSLLGSPAVAVIDALTSSVAALVGATAVAVIYVELRRLKEGVSVEGLASVFD